MVYDFPYSKLQKLLQRKCHIQCYGWKRKAEPWGDCEPRVLLLQNHPAVNEKTARTIKRVVTLNEVRSCTYEILSQFRVNLFIWSVSRGAFWVRFNLLSRGEKCWLALKERSKRHWLANVGNNQAVCGSTRGMLITGDLRPPTPRASAASCWLASSQWQRSSVTKTFHGTEVFSRVPVLHQEGGGSSADMKPGLNHFSIFWRELQQYVA